MKKIKGNGVTGMQIHLQREKESDKNPDIKKDQSHLNYDLVNDNPIDYHEKINQMIDERVDQSKRKVRKDAVKVASFLITSDKDFFEKIGSSEEKRFFETARDFIGERYGKENLAYAMVHKDEKTPHMHLGFVPITEDGRLSAKDFFGKKQQLHRLQDDFHAHMKEQGFDLERGLSSDRKHLEPAQYKLKTTQEQIKSLENELAEKKDMRNQLGESIKQTSSLLSTLKKSADQSKEVDEIKYKETGLISPKMVKLSSSDFESIKSKARALETLKIENKMVSERNKQLSEENNDLKLENKGLNRENQVLKHENRDLEKQNMFLTRTLDLLKEALKEHVKDFNKKLGAVKAIVLDSMKMTNKDKYLSDEEEREGARAYQKDKQRENKKESEHELE